MNILVTGGAGYIGEFMVDRLIQDGHTVVVADSLEKGHKDVVNIKAEFLQGNLLDKKFVASLFENRHFDGVIHFAGFISMAESMQNPGIYFENNVISSMNVVEEMVKHSQTNFIFSSTAGVYGNPTQIPIPEDHEKHPTNPYGESKLMVEHVLAWYREVYGLSYTCLRYFNASGAALDGSKGEQHDPETHIIPNAIRALLAGREFTLFGSDYKTSDGTCVRDYIHVLDLAEAHTLALKKLISEPGGYTYNVGTGNGYSNKEIVEAIELVSGQKLTVAMKDRRPGDADELIADASRIKKELGFSPQYSDVKTIVESAWKWHSGKKNSTQ